MTTKPIKCDDRYCKNSDSYGICRSDEPCDKKPMTTSEPTTGELIEQLHTFDNVDAVTITIAKAALLFIADRLESQEREIAVLTARAEQAEKNLHDAIFGTNHACFYCTMENCDGCTNSTVKEHFKYRALKPNKYLTIQDERGLPQDGEGKI